MAVRVREVAGSVNAYNYMNMTADPIRFELFIPKSSCVKNLLCT